MYEQYNAVVNMCCPHNTYTGLSKYYRPVRVYAGKFRGFIASWIHNEEYRPMIQKLPVALYQG